jgi:hypothetical protein
MKMFENAHTPRTAYSGRINWSSHLPIVVTKGLNIHARSYRNISFQLHIHRDSILYLHPLRKSRGYLQQSFQIPCGISRCGRVRKRDERSSGSICRTDAVNKKMMGKYVLDAFTPRCIRGSHNYLRPSSEVLCWLDPCSSMRSRWLQPMVHRTSLSKSAANHGK